MMSIEKLRYIEETGTVVYQSKMTHDKKNRKNFEVYTAEEFIAAITQHIPEKSFQMVRYYAMDGIQINHEGYVGSRGS